MRPDACQPPRCMQGSRNVSPPGTTRTSAVRAVRAEPPRNPGRRSCELLRYPYALIRDLWKGDLNLRAMSLVYTMLLAIVPLLAFAFSVLKGMGIHRRAETAARRVFSPGRRSCSRTHRHASWVRRQDPERRARITRPGISRSTPSISTIQKVEESLNFVWRVERPRSWARRISEYLSLMVIGPILTVAALGLDGESQQLIVRSLAPCATSPSEP